MLVNFAIILLFSAFRTATTDSILFQVQDMLDCDVNKKTWNYNSESKECEEYQHSGCGFRYQDLCDSFTQIFCSGMWDSDNSVIDPGCFEVQHYLWYPEKQKCLPTAFISCEADDDEISEEDCLELKDLICLNNI